MIREAPRCREGIAELRSFVAVVTDDDAPASLAGAAIARDLADREAVVGRLIAGKYRVRALLGAGGMGAVYAAEHAGAEVAIKLIDAKLAKAPETLARFAREARVMGAVTSPHIARVLDVGTDDGRPWIAMERLHGEDLGQRLRREHRLPLAEARTIIAQVLEGLGHAHAAGVVHRDLKPDNVFLVDGRSAKVLDFGISKIERPRDRTVPLALTGRGTVLGTPFYMSPEQAQAKPDLDARSDLYGVGAILFECLTGRPPHTGETYEQVLVAICLHDAPDVRTIDPAIPAAVAAFVSRALARRPEDRFASAGAMRAALPPAGASPRRARGTLVLQALFAMLLGIAATLLVIRLFGASR